MSASVQRKLQQAHLQLQNGNIDSAAALSAEVLQRAPRNPDALWLLGTAHLMSNRLDEAVPLLTRAVDGSPQNGAALEHLGLAHLMRGEYASAEAVLRRAASLTGAPASVPMRLGLALFHQDKYAESVEALQHSLALEPRNPAAHAGLGRAYGAQKLWDSAAREFEIVLAQAPDDADTLYNLGVVSVEQGHMERACSWFEKCLAEAPAHVEAHQRLAAAFLSLGRYRQAATELRQVVEMLPEHAGAWCALAEATFQGGNLDEALVIAGHARDLDPAQSSPYSLIAQIHHVRGELGHAVDALEAGLARTDADGLLGALVHLLHRQCNWSSWRPAWEAMALKLENGRNAGSPFNLLCEPTSGEQQLSYARQWAGTQFGRARARHTSAARRTSSAARRLKVGYFSSDFHSHPTAYLLAEVLELHDRSQFDVYAYSYGPDDHSPMRKRLESGVEHFVDVAWEPNDKICEQIARDELDILIDLKGYTMGDRLSVLAQRPCRLQGTWLGYPGTTGADFIDFLIADPVVVPVGAEALYSERIVRLPHCYQPNDRQRHGSHTRDRAEYGLPTDAVVFCCFTQAFKITPDVFSCWVRLLKRVPGSVLWLLHDNEWAAASLRAEASRRDVEDNRLIFASRIPLTDHLARYRAASMALDTFPYTSHTTGSDALWLGCPLVALCGDTFAARVSASLLTACEMSDLITHSLDEYEQLAFRLATEEEFMRSVKARIAVARDHAVLFDSTRFTRDLENLYRGLVQ